MRWVCLPQSFRLPGVQVLCYGLWMREDRELFGAAYTTGVRPAADVSPGRFAIFTPDNILPGVSVDGVHLAPQPTLYNGCPWFWTLGAGVGCVFYSLTENGPRWISAVYHGGPRAPLNSEPWYLGPGAVDAFASGTASYTFEARGTAPEGTTRTVARHWPRWDRRFSTPSDGLTWLGGTYSPVDGASGTRVIGMPCWRRSSDSVVFAEGSAGTISAPATGAEIVPASDVFPGDETGDYVFSDNAAWRLRSSPSASSSPYYYTLSDGVYTRAGRLNWSGIGVPEIPQAMFESSYSAPGTARQFLVGEPVAWQ